MQQDDLTPATVSVASTNPFTDLAGEQIRCLSDCTAVELIQSGELDDLAVARWLNQSQRDLAMAAWAAAPARMVKRPPAPPIISRYRRSLPGRRAASDGEEGEGETPATAAPIKCCLRQTGAGK